MFYPREKYWADTQNRQGIVRQMEQVLKNLFPRKPQKGEEKQLASGREDAARKSDPRNQAQKKRLSQKRIDMPFQDDDFNRFKIFYGKVFTEWRKPDEEKATEEKARYGICLYRLDGSAKGAYIGYLSMSKKVFQHLPASYTQSDRAAYAISFFAEFDNRGKMIAGLRHSAFLKMEEIVPIT